MSIIKRGKEPVEPLGWHHSFGWAVYILVGIVLFIGMAGRLASFISYKLAERNAATSADVPEIEQAAPLKQGAWSKVRTLYRRHISVPAAWGRNHMRPVGFGWFSVPTRLQAILIFAYVAINIIFSFVKYTIVDGPTPTSVQLGKQIGDRAGVIAIYNFPLLFALAGRNDILIWLTGWSFASMNLFHRWVARMTVLHAIIHSAAYTWLNRSKIPMKFHDSHFWAIGTFCTVCLCIILPLSVKPLRAKAYEIFLVVHIILAVATLVLLYLHVQVMSGSYNTWVWSCVGIWAFDRLVRFLRVVVLSFRTAKCGDNGRNAVARIADEKTGLIRLSVDSSIALTPTAGSYYFIYTPWSSTPWQSHPFSLASWEPSANGTGTTLHFVIAPRGGATSRLRRRIENSAETYTGTEGNGIKMRALLEGPYGCRHAVHRFDSVLLIAGGTGITAMLPYVFELARLGHKKVTVAWIVKDSSYAHDVLGRELSPHARGFASVDIFISSSGKLVRFDSEDTLQGVSEKAKKFIDDDVSEDSHTPYGKAKNLNIGAYDDVSQESTVNTRVSTPVPTLDTDSGCSTRVGTPIGSPLEGVNPFENMSPIEKKLNTGDLMAHLVMKKKFLSAESRSVSYSSNASSASTACDYDEVDALGGSNRTKVNSDAASISGASTCTSSSTSTLRYIPGRPAMRMLVNRALEQLVGNERLAIMGCGPSAMMDDLRSTVAESYGIGEGQVSARQLEYFEDAFEW